VSTRGAKVPIGNLEEERQAVSDVGMSATTRPRAMLTSQWLDIDIN